MNILNGIKQITEVLNAHKHFELVRTLNEMQSQSDEMRSQLKKLIQENEVLKEQLNQRSLLKWDGHIYWIRNDEMREDNGDTPVCPTCWDTKSQVVRCTIGQSWIPNGPQIVLPDKTDTPGYYKRSIDCDICGQTHLLD